MPCASHGTLKSYWWQVNLYFLWIKILYCRFEVAYKGSIMFKEESYVFLFLLLKNSFTPWKPDSLRDDTLILRITSLSSQHFLVHPQEFSLNPCHNDLCDYHSWTKNNSFPGITTAGVLCIFPIFENLKSNNLLIWVQFS